MRHVLWILVLAFPCAAEARKGRHEGAQPATVEEALADAESALDNGRIGDAVNESSRLQRTHGLKKDELRRLDLIVARCQLVRGEYGPSEKIFAKLRRATPDDVRLTEWYARALEGTGQDGAALELFTTLAQKDALSEGDSYWAMAQLERKSGKNDAARAHAKLALEKPIVMQSEELDRSIHKFIDELTPKKK